MGLKTLVFSLLNLRFERIDRANHYTPIYIQVQDDHVLSEKEIPFYQITITLLNTKHTSVWYL